MKCLYPWLVLLFALPAARAQPVALIALDGPLGSGVPALVEKFSSPEVKLDATFLTGYPTTPPIMVDLVLDGDELGTLWKSDIPFTPNKVQPNSALVGTFSLPLDKIDKPLHLRLIAFLPAQDGPRTVIAKIPLWVYPPNYYKDKILTLLTELGSHTQPPWRLAVFGEIDSLRKLLDAWDVSYQDLGRDPPAFIESQIIALGIGAPKPDATPTELQPTASLLWFRPDIEKPSGIYQQTSPDKVETYVNLTPPNDWADSPLFQRLLLEHLQQTIPTIHVN